MKEPKVVEEEIKEIGFEEAERLDSFDSMFWKPEVNVEYILTFSKWRLVRREIPKYMKPDEKEERSILELLIDSRDGRACEQQWDIISKKLREQIRPYCEGGAITENVFKFKMKGEKSKREYFVTLLRKREDGSPKKGEAKAAIEDEPGPEAFVG